MPSLITAMLVVLTEVAASTMPPMLPVLIKPFPLERQINRGDDMIVSHTPRVPVTCVDFEHSQLEPEERLPRAERRLSNVIASLIASTLGGLVFRASPQEVTLPSQTEAGTLTGAAAEFLVAMEAGDPHSYNAQLLQGAANVALIKA
jgi:hypothetical protein